MDTMERTALSPMGVDDRCDRCGARAYLAVQMKPATSVLLFCGHHGAALLPALLAQEPFDLRDDLDLLAPAPGSAATETAK